ncbi:MAG TPA: hypothetical protein QF720_06205 [Nitrospinota bacterium]|nr:hypothetical protein [Nitrospinota bacterium]|tara:strand:- start:284009 stop:284503 length:495 start_codon:yes stop_codon:yes gene_type:complete
MKTKVFVVILASLSLITLSGFRTLKPIFNVKDSEYMAVLSTKKNITLEDIRVAIKRAGVSLGWVIKAKKPGLLEGVLLVRRHRAVVKIPYDQDKYSILYEDSQNLFYSSKEEEKRAYKQWKPLKLTVNGIRVHRAKFSTAVIHHQYNLWVRKLNKEIRIQLSLL